MEACGGGKTTAEGAESGGRHHSKTSWPELVGKPVEEAKAAILRDMPLAHIVVVPVGSPVTMDYRLGRVRIFVDAHAVVAEVPHIG